MYLCTPAASFSLTIHSFLFQLTRHSDCLLMESWWTGGPVSDPTLKLGGYHEGGESASL